MYVLLGEKNVKILDESVSNLSYSDFFNVYSNKNCGNYNKLDNYHLIIDRKDVELSIDSLHDCSIIDAYRHLRCRKNFSHSLQDEFLIPNGKSTRLNLNVFKKTNFHVQKNAIKNKEFFDKIDLSSGIFLIEYAVAELCRKIREIDEETWWLYIARHLSSGVKIVAGVGSGILLSRILNPDDELNLSKEISGELLQTIRFLMRSGQEGELKIVNFIENIMIEDQAVETIRQEEVCLQLGIKKAIDHGDIESLLLNFVANDHTPRAVFSKSSRPKLFFRKHIKKLIPLLLMSLLLSIFSLVYLKNQISSVKNSILFLEKSRGLAIWDKSGTFRARPENNNFLFLKQFVALLKKNRDPVDTIIKVSELIDESGIVAENFFMKNGDYVEIRTSINPKEESKLLAMSNKEIEIKINKIEPERGEYEEIKPKNKNESYGAIICIKTN